MGNQQSFKTRKNATVIKAPTPSTQVSQSAYYRIPVPKLLPNEKSEAKRKSVIEKSDSSDESFKERDREDSDIDPDIEESTAIDNDTPITITTEAKCTWIGLPSAEAKVLAEKEIRNAFENPHPSFITATPITNITKEKIMKDGLVLDSVAEKVSFRNEQIIYELRLESVALRCPKTRTSRSKIDPWRRYGAFAKLCEIGGFMPESKTKGVKAKSFILIKKGSKPPPPPKTKPLTTIDEYMTFKGEKSN